MENIITNFTKLIYQKSLRIRRNVLDFVILFEKTSIATNFQQFINSEQNIKLFLTHFLIIRQNGIENDIKNIIRFFLEFELNF